MGDYYRKQQIRRRNTDVLPTRILELRRVFDLPRLYYPVGLDPPNHFPDCRKHAIYICTLQQSSNLGWIRHMH